MKIEEQEQYAEFLVRGERLREVWQCFRKGQATHDELDKAFEEYWEIADRIR